MRAQLETINPGRNRSFLYSERRIPRFDSPWHFHPEIELTLILSSAGRRFVGDSIEPFAAGDLVLIGPNLPHFWHNPESSTRQPPPPAHSIVVQFLPETWGSSFWSMPECTRVRRLLARSARGLQFSGASARQAARRLQALGSQKGLPALLELVSILDLLGGDRSSRPLASFAYEPSLNDRTQARLGRVYGFLIEQFREPITLSQIATVAAMTPPGFSRYFRRTTGRNVSVFLNELRVDHAAQLLAETDRTIADIALGSGFPTLSNFNRRFRERLGLPPRDYRRALASSSLSPPSP
jgi:AraC-like DNA-binding protein